MTIPIRNVFHLLCYAWDALEQLDEVEVGTAGSHHVGDLIASILVRGVNDLLRRGLDREYIEHAAEVVGVRGRIDFAATASRMLLPLARTHCRFDELAPDVLHNQILRETLRVLSGVTDLSHDHRVELHDAWLRMDGVSRIRLDASLFGRVRIHRNNSRYRFLLNLSRLAYDSTLVEEGGTGASFIDFTREKSMERLFQRFVRNFYAKHRPVGVIVTSPIEQWQPTEGTEDALSMLPRLETDVVLESKSGTLIIDTKYYGDPLQRRYERAKLRPEHVNQVMAYVSNFDHAGYPLPVEGMLLYAATESLPELSVDLKIHGHRFRAAALNLDAPWPAIEGELRELVGWPSSRSPGETSSLPGAVPQP